MLTAKQRELLQFIQVRLEETGVSPSFEEMKEALDLKSKSGIHRLITALEERGFIRRLAHRARALEVMKLPERKGGIQVRLGRQPFKPGDLACLAHGIGRRQVVLGLQAPDGLGVLEPLGQREHQHPLEQQAAGPELGHAGAHTRASPSRCATSLKKMRTCAIGFLRTSRLFM